MDWGWERNRKRVRWGDNIPSERHGGDPETKGIIDRYKNDQRVEESLNRDLS